MHRWTMALSMGLAAGLAGSAAAQPDPLGVIHSDLPLFMNDVPEQWPRRFSESGEIGGCRSRVAFGIWRYDAAGEDDTPYWSRVANYGAMHCWAWTSSSEKRDDLDKAQRREAYFIMIGRTKDRELWVIQRGTRPGSDYDLLARAPGPGVIKKFEALQSICPRSMERNAGNLELFATRYCAINSRADLLAVARQMAKLPPLGTLTWVEDLTDD